MHIAAISFSLRYIPVMMKVFASGITLVAFGIVFASVHSDSVEYLAALADQYPAFEVVGPIFGPDGDRRGDLRSPEDFVDDILIGDFNSDGVTDFAAALIEKGAVRAALDGGSPVGFAVVCNGDESRGSATTFHCTQMTEIRPHGFRAEIDLMNWTPWLDLLLSRNPHPNNPECPIYLKATASQKLLSIVSPYGLCDTFYYPLDGAEYGTCTYCAD